MAHLYNSLFRRLPFRVVAKANFSTNIWEDLTALQKELKEISNEMVNIVDTFVDLLNRTLSQ